MPCFALLPPALLRPSLPYVAHCSLAALYCCCCPAPSAAGLAVPPVSLFGYPPTDLQKVQQQLMEAAGMAPVGAVPLTSGGGSSKKRRERERKESAAAALQEQQEQQADAELLAAAAEPAAEQEEQGVEGDGAGTGDSDLPLPVLEQPAVASLAAEVAAEGQEEAQLGGTDVNLDSSPALQQLAGQDLAEQEDGGSQAAPAAAMAVPVAVDLVPADALEQAVTGEEVALMEVEGAVV